MKLVDPRALAFASLATVGTLPAMMVTNASPALAASALSALDTDKDGTVDLAEAKAAASTEFDKLDKLDRKELQGRISNKDWAAADPDNDKTVSKDEYLNFVEDAFKRADPDNDGTIDAKELRSRDGQALVRLLR